MNQKVIISIVVAIVTLIAIGIGTYLVLNRQNLFSQAQQVADTSNTNAVTGQGGGCAAPGTPATVTLSYPLCETPTGSTQEQCQFTKAGCVWEAVSGASKYSVKVTEVETGATIATETINAPTTKTSFPVVQGRTYKCEVSAVSSCGATGGTNSDSLLCQTDAFVSPAPSATPVAPPPVSTPVVSTPIPVPVATPPPIACGFTGCSTTTPCQAGFICVQTSVGQNYCARTEYQTQCFRSPGEAACCQARPTPQPTLPPAGMMENTLIIGGAGIGLVILGAAALLLL